MTLVAVLATAALFITKGLPTNKSLLAAAHEPDLQAVHRAIRWGAEANTARQDGWIPLDAAACSGMKEIAELLIAKGAAVNAKTTDGRTPLHSAAGKGHVSVAALLVAHGADVNAKDKDGCTPLHYAAIANRRDVAELLLRFGADLNDKDRNGMTPLTMAHNLGSHEVTALLTRLGNKEEGLLRQWSTDQILGVEPTENAPSHKRPHPIFSD